MGDEKEKLNSDKVPSGFTEWLLAMGCPVEKVPNLDNAKQMCRGQYYIVWRSLMEEVEPKDSIRHKRLSVFCDDLNEINDNNSCDNQHKKNLIEPDELTLWHEETDLREKVSDAESRIIEAKKELNHLVDKVSSKLSNRNTSSRHTQDAQRRVLLLQKLIEHLEARKSDLQETIKIANSLSYAERNIENENKLDKCIASLRRQNRLTTSSYQSMLSTGNSTACSSIMSTNSESDYENNIASLVKCRGDSLWPQLYERRAGLCIALSQACAQQPTNNSDRTTPKSVLAQTAALHCTIALEAMKNKAHIRQTQKMLATAITQLNDYLSSDACEYLVLNCERTGAQSRVNTLKGILEEIVSREGLFEINSRYTGDKNGARQQITNVDKTILNKKEELKNLLRSLNVTERKIANIKQCLETVFDCLNNGTGLKNIDKFRDLMSLPQDSIVTIQQFYKERSTKQKKIDISFDLDMSENNSLIDCTENANPTFVDELRMYLQRFSLEKNRKLVLENGEKIWVQETVQSYLHRLLNKWQAEELPCSLLCPSVGLGQNLRTISNAIQWKCESDSIVQNLDKIIKENCIDIDITSKILEENEMVDKIKKRLNDNLISLQKINRTLDLGADNIEFWDSNSMKQYISSNRTIDGKTYKDYENIYLYSLKI